MRIAIISQPENFLLPDEVKANSSIVIWIQQIARRLARDCEVSVYTTTRHFRAGMVKQTLHGVTYYGIPGASIEARIARFIRKREKARGYPNPKRPFIASEWYYRAYAVLVALDLRRHGFDVVHVINYTQFVPVIRMFNPKIKILLNMHCEWLNQFDPMLIERRVAKADRVTGCSDFIAKKARDRFPTHQDKIGAIWNGTDPDLFQCSPRESGSALRLLYVGRISPEKGVHILMQAFNRIHAQYPQVTLTVVGPFGNAPLDAILLLSDDEKLKGLTELYREHSGPVGSGYRTHLESLLDPEAAPHVTFTGAINHTELVAHYCDADIFVFPSLWDEPFGIPVIEAMASGLPVVSTRGGGITEIVEAPHSGLLVERGSVDELANAVMTLLEDASLRRDMADRARERVNAHLTWDQVAAQYFQEYKVLYANTSG